MRVATMIALAAHLILCIITIITIIVIIIAIISIILFFAIELVGRQADCLPMCSKVAKASSEKLYC